MGQTQNGSVCGGGGGSVKYCLLQVNDKDREEMRATKTPSLEKGAFSNALAALSTGSASEEKIFTSERYR